MQLQDVRSWRDPLGRAGLATKGVLYLVVGLLAVQFARGDTSSSNVGREGAIETVARQPFGKFLLVAIVVGLVALTLWHVVLVVTGDPVKGGEAKDRARYAVKAVIYGAASVTAWSILAANWSAPGTSAGDGQSGSGSGSGNESEQQATAMLLDLPAGRLITGAVGLGLVGFGIWQVVHHTVQAKFMKRISASGTTEDAIELFGRIGHAARAVVFAMVGIFMVVAAVQYDPSESKGLSGALAELAERTGGAVLLWLVALGLFAYGLFTLAEARFRPAA
jgi:hypothetical protein